MNNLQTELSSKVDMNLQQIYNQIKGKNVFIFDLETTGLFERKDFYKYWDNNVFNNARIIEIGYYYSDNFDNDNVYLTEFSNKLEDILGCVTSQTNPNLNQTNPNLNQTNPNLNQAILNDFITNDTIHTYLRKPTDFNTIDPIAESKHGISIESLMTSGYKFSQILNVDLLKKLNNAEYIISHNTMFDFYVLLNELHRFKLKNTINHLLKIKKDKKLLCTCKASGFMSLEKLYITIFNDVPTVFHRAGDDVKTLVEIITRKKLNLVYKTKLIDW
jgi:DNA polymerase III epsilon subunit-like protein